VLEVIDQGISVDDLQAFARELGTDLDSQLPLIKSVAENSHAGFVAEICSAAKRVGLLCCAYVGTPQRFPSALISVWTAAGYDFLATPSALAAMARSSSSELGLEAWYLQVNGLLSAANAFDSRWAVHKELATMRSPDPCVIDVPADIVVTQSAIGTDEFWSVYNESQPEAEDCFDHELMTIRDWAHAQIPGREVFYLEARELTSDKVVGVMLPFLSSKVGWCEGMSVSPSARGKHVGKALLAGALRTLRVNGAETIFSNVECRRSTAAAKLLAGAGFSTERCSTIYKYKAPGK
jgi:GNAT superfamily N-acetyltransferase